MKFHSLLSITSIRNDHLNTVSFKLGVFVCFTSYALSAVSKARLESRKAAIIVSSLSIDNFHIDNTNCVTDSQLCLFRNFDCPLNYLLILGAMFLNLLVYWDFNNVFSRR